MATALAIRRGLTGEFEQAKRREDVSTMAAANSSSRPVVQRFGLEGSGFRSGSPVGLFNSGEYSLSDSRARSELRSLNTANEVLQESSLSVRSLVRTRFQKIVFFDYGLSMEIVGERRVSKCLEPVWVEWPYAKIRREIRTDDGEVTRFVIQLEYDLNATLDGRGNSDWRVVARFDHDPEEGQGHDITDEGLHMDVYRDSEKFRRAWDFPRVELRNAPGYCQEYLQRHAEWLLARFEAWHGVRREER